MPFRGTPAAAVRGAPCARRPAPALRIVGGGPAGVPGADRVAHALLEGSMTVRLHGDSGTVDDGRTLGDGGARAAVECEGLGGDEQSQCVLQQGKHA
jgi:hypothetical protein